MRVLLVHNFYQILGGEGSVVQDELALLAQNGVEVDLFSATNEDITGLWSRLTTGLQVVYNPLARYHLARKLKEFLPDVVHIHNFFPRLSPSILDACITAGVPSVMTLHNFRIFSPAALLHPAEAVRDHNLRAPCWWSVPKKIYRNSVLGTLAVAAMIEFHKIAGTWNRKVTRFIALTNWAKQQFIEGGLPPERIVVKPSSVARPTLPGEGPRHGALYVGRLDEQKGIRNLLRAWREVDYPVRIVGDGPLSEFVAQNTSKRVVYLGRQSREAVQREMRAARFLVMPATGTEMLPLTILEAFANSLPVICSDLPVLTEIVERSGGGVTFAAGDAGALAARARWAASNEAALAKLGRRALEIYEDRYTPETNFARLTEIYSDAIYAAHASSGAH